MKAKNYSTNVSGERRLIRAYSLKQVADYLETSLSSLRPYTAIAADWKTPDVDLTAPNNGMNPSCCEAHRQKRVCIAKIAIFRIRPAELPDGEACCPECKPPTKRCALDFGGYACTCGQHGARSR